MNDIRVSIIGAGPAGIACAVQLKRYDIPFRIFERDRIGGLVRNANLVENYLGYPDGISGEALTDLFRRHLRENKINVINEKADSVAWGENGFLINTRDSEFSSDIVVAASGTKPKPAPVSVPERLEGRVYSEVYPLRDLKESRVAIAGAGDAAFDYALFLSARNDVTILNRSGIVKCLPLLEKRAKRNPRIKYLDNIRVSTVRSKENEILLDCIQAGRRCEISSDFLLFAVGREPETAFLSSISGRQKNELLEKKLLYIIGDAANSLYRQVSIASGEGIMTAMKIAKALEARKETNRNGEN
ncbi:MAG: NAD(P)/FAD-dependent oxidoreductase [Candidatus Krumholzibacteriota bacterium]|nr:NAD(P)/FAD-dependent oxidoreductase [Candidatus Krumholzibacteriota bacterium]